MTTEYKHAAFVLGQSPTALYAIRELGRAGIAVFGEIFSPGPATSSKYLKGARPEKGFDSDDERVAFLLEQVPRGDRAVLVVSSDQDVAFVSDNADKLQSSFFIEPCLSSGLAVRLMDKEELYNTCAEYDVATPGCWTRPVEELGEIVEELSFPCLIKPSVIHEVKSQMAGKKLWTLRSAAEYQDLLSKLPVGNTNWIVQEIIPGPESEIWLYCAYYDQQGRPSQTFTARKLRQYPPGFGSASLVRSESNAELVKICERFFRGVGYKGIATAEFKCDPRDGILKMIEVNPRPSLWFGVSSAAGKRITLAAYHDALGLPALSDSAQKDGVIWRYLLKDLYSKLFYILNPHFILPPPSGLSDQPVTARVGAVFSSRDLSPVLGELISFIRKLSLRLRK